MEHFLVLSALGTDRAGIVDELARAASDSRCNIADSRMIVMGQELALIMMLSGTWDAIAKLEAQLPNLGKRLNLVITFKRTEPRAVQAEAMPYNVHVIALDNPGIVHEIANFFAIQGINIEAMETSTYAAPHTGSPMFALSMTVNIPARVHVASLRENFMLFCDDRNLDAIIEPFKN
ncbi:MAG: glycine cleavage system protein R [Moraxellaceae bacterium]|jgi:glycine cleavage system transcriptional repressor|nr:glycine cleavage system protein R [Moraxellaceae bacterium]MBP9046438.1 glycine cleavage system protein R [Moraxellaceae bacterium]MBP9731447.1 glycine cleavage system protein R [Moraxellaceae bacterium]HQV41259.1 glycine cleavage system protein R [Moraxellaceae bacterium]HQX90709.1 glycine cleavage system protein R [Moraxellaceae bacterium]